MLKYYDLFALNIENIKTILRGDRDSGKSKDMNAGLKKQQMELNEKAIDVR